LATLQILTHFRLIQLLAKLYGKNASEYLQLVLTDVFQLIFRHNCMRGENGVGVLVKEQHWK
jgi:hypothetical protein